MTTPDNELSGPDLAQGVPLSSLADGAMLPGHAHGEPMLLVRRGDELFAIGAVCTHYGGPLADGLLVDDTVRCPWHHACFSLRTGEAQRPRHWIRSRAGASSSGTAAPTSARSLTPQPHQLGPAAGIPQVGGHRRRWRGGQCRRRNAAPGRLFRSASRCSAPMRPCRAIARICRKAISPGRRPKSGFHCAHPSSTRSTALT